MGAPEPHRVACGDVEIACFEWNPELRGRGPTLLLVHATGFHARCWDPVLARMPAHHAVAVDMRGHGRSTNVPIEHWADLGRDLACVAEALDLRDVVGVGHSMGGHALCDAAALAPDRFRRLVLLDPVIASPDAYGGGWKIQMPEGEPHPTAKRKRHFDSPEAMIERFRDRDPYAGFTPDALRAYCEHGLLPRDDGDGFDLACPPEVEASVYMTSRTNPDVHASIRALAIPVLVVRAKLPPPDRTLMDFASSPTWPALAGEFADGRDLHLAEHSHFLPMEIPERIAALVEEELSA
ncbi:MAG: alpha/beta fold hydrolase [Myxococcota bacterium]